MDIRYHVMFLFFNKLVQLKHFNLQLNTNMNDRSAEEAPAHTFLTPAPPKVHKVSVSLIEHFF